MKIEILYGMTFRLLIFALVTSIFLPDAGATTPLSKSSTCVYQLTGQQPDSQFENSLRQALVAHGKNPDDPYFSYALKTAKEVGPLVDQIEQKLSQNLPFSPLSDGSPLGFEFGLGHFIFVVDLRQVTFVDRPTPIGVVSNFEVRTPVFDSENLRYRLNDELSKLILRLKDSLKLIHLVELIRENRLESTFNDIENYKHSKKLLISRATQDDQEQTQSIIQNGLSSAPQATQRFTARLKESSLFEALSLYQEAIRNRKGTFMTSGGRGPLLGFTYGDNLANPYYRGSRQVVYEIEAPQAYVNLARHFAAEFAGEEEYILPLYVPPFWIKRILRYGRVIFERPQEPNFGN